MAPYQWDSVKFNSTCSSRNAIFLILLFRYYLDKFLILINLELLILILTIKLFQKTFFRLSRN